MPRKADPDPETVKEIVSLTTSKCFDWAQGCIAETMGAVAAQLAENAVVCARETAIQDVQDGLV